MLAGDIEDLRLMPPQSYVLMTILPADNKEECGSRTEKGTTVTRRAEGRSGEGKEGASGQLAGGMSICWKFYDW